MITETDELLVEKVEVISGKKLFNNPNYRKDNYKIYLKGYKDYFVDAVDDSIDWMRLNGKKVRGLYEYESIGKNWLGCKSLNNIEIIISYTDIN